RNQQKLGPHWCQGQVQNQQDEETDKQGREQGPDEVSVAIEKQRSGLNAVLLECRQHNGCGRGRWKAHGQQCAHRGTGGSVTCSFWASDTTDSTLVAELGILTALIQVAFGCVCHKGGHFCTTDGDNTERNAEA